ncbi:MAG TPA: Gfo/Idh/MocA family oxidoreductase [Longimicrobiales bacterium]|nr:Gfo/Idh/MocA family oxidoreductase [Longimicrobiales bacterium]
MSQTTKGEVRIAVVGTGAIAQIVHLPLLGRIQGASVVAVCDRDEAKARAIAGRMGVPRVFEDDDEAFASDDVDAVILCTPSHMHEEQAVAALEAGKHVLVERPLAMDAKGAEKVIDAAEKAGRTLMVALNNRYRPDILGVKAFVAGGELGEVYAVRGAWHNRKVRPNRLTWRYRRDTAGGGVFMDLGIQVLDLCLWMLDYPAVEGISADLHAGEGMEVEDAGVALFRLAGGGSISVDVTWSLLGERDRHELRLFGSAGTASIQPVRVFKEVEHATLDVTPRISTGGENTYTASYREQLRDFIRAAGAETPPEPPREQVELMRLVTQVYRSAGKGREIRT